MNPRSVTAWEARELDGGVNVMDSKKVNTGILALDLGTEMGWATEIDGHRHFGTWTFRSGRYEGGGMRFLRFHKQLDTFMVYQRDGLYRVKGVSAIYFEEVRRHLGVDAAHVYAGFMTVLQVWCEERKIPYQGIPVGTIKKHATGKGNANKEQMMEAALRHGWNVEDDNQADALLLLDYVLTHEV